MKFFYTPWKSLLLPASKKFLLSLLMSLVIIGVSSCDGSGSGRLRSGGGNQCPLQHNPAPLEDEKLEKASLKAGEENSLPVGHYKYVGADYVFIEELGEKKKLIVHMTETVNNKGEAKTRSTCVRGFKLDTLAFSGPEVQGLAEMTIWEDQTVDLRVRGYAFRWEPSQFEIQRNAEDQNLDELELSTPEDIYLGKGAQFTVFKTLDKRYEIRSEQIINKKTKVILRMVLDLEALPEKDNEDSPAEEGSAAESPPSGDS